MQLVNHFGNYELLSSWPGCEHLTNHNNILHCISCTFESSTYETSPLTKNITFNTSVSSTTDAVK